MEQILLINSKTRGPYWRPTGLEYLAEALSLSGYEVQVLDLTIENRPEFAVKETIGKKHYDAVGISIFNTQWDTGRDRVSFFLPEIRGMIADIKMMINVPVILGGYGFSIQPEDILEYVGGDFGVAGCGTQALPNLLERIKHKAVETGTVVKDPSEKYLDIEFSRNAVSVDNYPDDDAVHVSVDDGCISNCSHCPFGSAKSGLRLRDPVKVIAEVRSLIEQGVQKVTFTTDMINASVAHARAICTGMMDLPVKWTTDVYPILRYLPPDLIDSMMQSGMFQAHIGSRIIGSDTMLRVYGEKFDSRDIEYTTKLFNEREISTSWFVGFGAPGECKRTIDETFSLIDNAKPEVVSIITKTRIYRQAELFKVAEKEGIVSPDDRLLEPVYYPFEDELRDYIWNEAMKRENCTVYY